MNGLWARICGTFSRWRRREPRVPLARILKCFRSILARNSEILDLMATMGKALSGDYVFDSHFVHSSCQRLIDLTQSLIHDLNILSGQKYVDLYASLEGIRRRLDAILAGQPSIGDIPYTLFYEDCNRDWIDEVGGKNANLGEVRNVLALPTPDGFVITTRAYHEFMASAGLSDFLTQQLNPWETQDTQALEQRLRDLQRRIEASSIPEKLAREIYHRIETLGRKYRRETLFFAVRSSASGEDTEHSFAGLHRSLLNVPETEVLQAYRQVVASLFTLQAWRYRRDKGFGEHEAAMAVGCQLMVDAVVSGVLYTVDPTAPPHSDALTVSATWGLGPPVVEGNRKVDRFRVSRDPPHALLQMHVVPKTASLISQRDGGTQWVDVSEVDQSRSCLNSQQLNLLASTGLLLERYFKRPQDIEWAFDTSGQLIILQTRPLQINLSDSDICRISDITASAPVLWSGRGDVVQRGIAVGKAFVVQSDEDLKRVPADAIVVARESSPRLAALFRHVRGVITDVGSPLGHMATVAREFRVPTVVNTEIATQLIHTGDPLTLDATQNVLYRGYIKELSYHELTYEEVFEETYEYRLLRRLLRLITPLHLVDPKGTDFTPAGCRTLHDIVRFVHERAVAELVGMNLASFHTSGCQIRLLEIPVPLDLRVIDADGGTVASPDARTLRLQDVTSIPMRAFLAGVVESNLWERTPVAMDFKSFLASMSRTFDTHRVPLEEVGLNLAVVSSNYMNINLRIGYHFNIIDAYVDDRIDDNYIYFRFIGGVTDLTRRSRRARLIGEILDRTGFRVEIRGDLVVGRMKKRPRSTMEHNLGMLGALVAYTRQLDVQMISDEEVVRHVERFMELFRSLWPRPQAAEPQGGSHGQAT
ncbi:PEP/pyruvate-binding domain-containing protein [Desulfosoma caldarium]|uniref:Phosphoenolpyruvate synthase n=1 Tax=Desulfosoma caldarium TaxID=610254 RepID=A0A3N1VPM6_9BACT|nr:PEP/pyruvate-binding domain-containing protein [Desulfosoma caldarium]ROR02991.1 pyruvate,water dikinase [Desulfosoma caldarium]